MPTYQYACTECGHQLEAVQSFTDEPLAQCPACPGRLRKVFNSVGIVFKGSGFYRTDSRNGNGNGAKPADAPATPAAEKPKADAATKPDAAKPAAAKPATSGAPAAAGSTA